MAIPPPSPKEVQAFLDDLFWDARPPKTWLQRLFGSPDVRDDDNAFGLLPNPIRRDEEFAGIFQKHAIFRIHARGYVLQQLLPGGITCGLVSYDGIQLRHLRAADPSEF